MYDVTIIGAGIVGTAVARELARCRLRTLLLEKESDVANGTTKANSAIVHAGYDALPGTAKARFNVAGNRRYEPLCRELGVPFRRTGSLVVAYSDEEMATVRELYRRGCTNGVPDLAIIDRDTLLEWEPHVAPRAVGALSAPTAGIVGAWELAIALAENAAANGAEVRVNCPVEAVTADAAGFTLRTPGGALRTRVVINAAGLHADTVHRMICPDSFTITPNRGEYMLFDKDASGYVRRVVFQCPTSEGKNVVVLPTVHGNLLVGPTAAYVDADAGTETTAAGLAELSDRTRDRFTGLPWRQVITSFAGLRAKTPGGDFIVEPSPAAPGFINAAGIDSPGLTAAPAIAEYVVGLAAAVLGEMAPNPGFNPHRRPPVQFASLPPEEKAALIRRDPRYGRIVCRCESVTEGEIVDAVRRSFGGATVDGIKRRTRAGGGRCQGGFCTPRLMEIIAREQGIGPEQVRKDGPGSWLVAGRPRPERGEDEC